MSSFVGKVCVVTGASSGIGYQTAFDLASEGARVCVVARRKERLEELLQRMPGSGHSLAVTDVSDRNGVRSLVDHVRDEHGRCDVLINNAGFSKERPLLEDGAVDDLKAMMDTNFYGTVYCTAEFLPLLIGSAPSSVVNVASMAGRLAIGGAPGYSASKFAVVGFSEALYFQLLDSGVCVSVVEPGLIPTEGFPQTPVLSDPVLKHTLGSVEAVSKAIRSAIAGRKMERVVPRWYYALQLPRIVAPPLYRLIQRKLVTPNKGTTGT